MPGERAGLAVTRFLRAEEQVVPFRARPELGELLTWCATEAPVAVRLVVGDGGTGKTRLALRLCQELEENGWQPLWVHHGEEAAAAGAAREIGTPCVLVVDYAETRDDLVSLLRAVAAAQPGPDVRVVLLARASGEWWQRLVNGSDERVARLLTAPPVVVGPITVKGGPAELFDEALTEFAKRLEISRPNVRLMLTEREPVVLVVHAAALLAVLDHALGRGDDRILSRSQVLDGLLGHEARYWTQSAAARGLDLDVAVQRLAVAVGSLIGADGETGAADLMSRVPDLADSAERRGKVARWLHDLYPEGLPDEAGTREWVGPLRPDPVAEHLIVAELSRRPELIPGLFRELGKDRALRALTVLARTTGTEPGLSLLRHALAADLEHLAVPAVRVAIATNPVVGGLINDALHNQTVSVGTLEQIAAAAPFRSLALAPVAATVLASLVDQSADIGQRAGRLLDLCDRLSGLGRWEEACAAGEEAVAIRRGQAQERPDAFLPDLALALNNWSNVLGALGRREEAMAAIEEAIAIRRDLAAAHPDQFLPDLAMSLNNRAFHLNEMGRWEEALATSREAVAIRRSLIEDHPDVLPGLAASLGNQSISLSALGRQKEALATSEEATLIYRPLVQGRPDTYLPDFGRILSNQSMRLADVGQKAGALAVAEEATRLYRVLAMFRPGAFTSDLAASLNNLSLRLAEMGRTREAVAEAEESVRIYRNLAQDRPGVTLPNLAASVDNLALYLGALGRGEDACAVGEEAVAIRRDLAAAYPDTFLPNLAASLNNQALHLAGIGRQVDALAVVEEAVAIRRDLAQARPDVFLPDLAKSQRNLSLRLAEMSHRPEALAVVEKAVSIYRRLAEGRPDTFFPILASALIDKSQRLDEMGRHEDAVAAIKESEAIRRDLAQASPTSPSS